MQNYITHILQQWDMHDVKLLRQYDVSGNRIVCKVQTNAGIVVVKGQPVAVPEERILRDISAYAFLGNKHHMAPRLYYRADGSALWKDETHYYCVMEYIDGRQAEENTADEYCMGVAAARLHKLTGYDRVSCFQVHENLQEFRTRYSNKAWKNEYDAIVDAIPDFTAHRQCLIHTDIRPANVMIRNSNAIFIDLDGAGLGPQYLDLGWPFISQFVDYNKKTGELRYQFDIANAFLAGYCSEYPLSREAYQLLWWGAVYTHIYNMQWYELEDIDPLWNILQFGFEQKDALLQLASYIEA